jgi:hypothetical protein
MGIRSLLTPLVVLAGASGCAAHSPPVAAPSGSALSARVPSGFTLQRTGDVHDFDYLAGAWTTVQRKLRERGVGSTDWEEFPATQCVVPYLGGIANVDELYMPTKQAAGLTLRAFDSAARQWSLYWVSSTTGRLEPAVIGGFDGDRGEFYSNDQWQGRPEGPLHLAQARCGSRELGTGVLVRQRDLGDELDGQVLARRYGQRVR